MGQVIDKIGRTARVVSNPVDKKYATAHDLRRSFGTRWASRVRTPVLQKLMRHANIATTMQYYVDLAVDEMADELWAKHPPAAGNISGNTGLKSEVHDEAADDATSSGIGVYHPK